jgi:hypothetical protein
MHPVLYGQSETHHDFPSLKALFNYPRYYRFSFFVQVISLILLDENVFLSCIVTLEYHYVMRHNLSSLTFLLVLLSFSFLLIIGRWCYTSIRSQNLKSVFQNADFALVFLVLSYSTCNWWTGRSNKSKSTSHLSQQSTDTFWNFDFWISFSQYHKYSRLAYRIRCGSE